MNSTLTIKQLNNANNANNTHYEIHQLSVNGRPETQYTLQVASERKKAREQPECYKLQASRGKLHAAALLP